MSFITNIARITDHLYLSGAAAIKTETLIENNIKCVINATMDIPPVDLPDVFTLKIQLDDTPSAQIAPHFEQCIEEIEKTRKEGGNTLVHCLAGVSRSASICIAYLMKTKGLSLREAYNHVKARRDVVHPNVGFFRQLISYEEQLFGETTVKMVPSEFGDIPDVYSPQNEGNPGIFRNLFDKITKR